MEDRQHDDITRIVNTFREGEVSREGVERIQREVRAIVDGQLAKENGWRELSASGLVQDVLVRLTEAGVVWTDRKHFYSAASVVVRRILVDLARRRAVRKKALDHLAILKLLNDNRIHDPAHMLSVEEALDALAAYNPPAAMVVLLRFFTGLTIAQTAEALSVGESTVKRLWIEARAFLHDFLTGGGDGPAGEDDDEPGPA